jgi:hypothetical protein
MKCECCGCWDKDEMSLLAAYCSDCLAHLWFDYVIITLNQMEW